MEEFSAGKVDATQKVGPDEEDNGGLVRDFEELKPEVESVKEVVDENSQSLKETHDMLSSDSGNTPEEEAVDKDQSPPGKDSGTLKEEVEKEVTNIIASAEPIESLPQELSSTVEASIEKSKESDANEGKIFPSSNENNEMAPVAADGVLNVTKKIISPPTTLDEIVGDLSEEVSGGPEEIKLPSSDVSNVIETDIVSEVRGIEEKVLPSLDENGGEPPALADVESKRVEEAKMVALEDDNGESSGIVDKESVESDDDSLKPSNNASIIGSSDGFPESTEHPHVISLNQRTLQDASLKSCCGLFEVLRRSNGWLKI